MLARRDELQEEDPPIEAMRVWVSMRELRPWTDAVFVGDMIVLISLFMLAQVFPLLMF